MLESKASLCHICMDLPVNMFCFVLFCFLIIIRHMFVQSNSFKKLTFIYLFFLYSLPNIFNQIPHLFMLDVNNAQAWCSKIRFHLKSGCAKEKKKFLLFDILILNMFLIFFLVFIFLFIFISLGFFSSFRNM